MPNFQGSQIRGTRVALTHPICFIKEDLVLQQHHELVAKDQATEYQLLVASERGSQLFIAILCKETELQITVDSC